MNGQNEGYLGKISMGGERVATEDHPSILHVCALDSSVTSALGVGTLMKRVIDTDDDLVTYAPCGATDTPCAVVDYPCDPSTESTVKCIVHGTVKARLLLVGSSAPTNAMISKLQDCGIFAL